MRPSGGRWTGRVLSGLAVLFLLMDGLMKLLKLPPAVEATGKLGYPDSMIVGIGVLLLALTLIYLVPRSSVLGAVLLTGYLGGAIASQLRAGAPAFNVIFPALISLLLWGGLWLRDAGLRTVLPLRVPAR